MLHVEHYKKKERRSTSLFFYNNFLSYLPNFISITFISAGLTPGMRDA